MDVSFTSSDVLNTSVIDQTKECLLFEVSTPGFKINRITTIKNAAGEVVAEFEPHRAHHESQVTLNGYTTTLSQWLPKRSASLIQRVFTAPNGQVYIWKEKQNGSFKLVPENSEDADPVVETRNAKVFSRSRKGGMTVDPELMPFLDAILLSFVICERESQERMYTAPAA